MKLRSANTNAKARQTPQEKKIADYKNQRRNHYGENHKSSRKAIRKRKRWVNKAYRKNIRNKIACLNETDAFDSTDIANVSRHHWVKYADILLLEDLDMRWSGSSRSRHINHQSKTRKEAIKRLKKSKKPFFCKSDRFIDPEIG